MALAMTAANATKQRRALAPEGMLTRNKDLIRASLSVMVMMVMVVIQVVVVMMLMGSERRAGKHHQKQYGGKNLLHARNVTRARRLR